MKMHKLQNENENFTAREKSLETWQFLICNYTLHLHPLLSWFSVDKSIPWLAI